MKKSFVLLFVLCSTIACQKNEDAVLSQEAAVKRLPAEQYMPGAAREIITLESGITVEKIAYMFLAEI